MSWWQWFARRGTGRGSGVQVETRLVKVVATVGGELRCEVVLEAGLREERAAPRHHVGRDVQSIEAGT
jgi:hypothetical protein